MMAKLASLGAVVACLLSVASSTSCTAQESANCVNCRIVLDSQADCTQCENGYGLQGFGDFMRRCAACPSDANCQEQGHQLCCNKCSNGYGVNTTSLACVRCPRGSSYDYGASGCAGMSNLGTCQCPSGQEFDDVGPVGCCKTESTSQSASAASSLLLQHSILLGLFKISILFLCT
mmetsp:Transcript_53188/g.154844  ORF Transcript_53188/g.154844 Transcript_53188/m.154844 type:complete len:176 (+) Transcript_53188:135-662(+)